MKKGFFVLVLVTAIAGCLKNDIKRNCDEVKDVAPASEVAALKTYLTTNNITATEDPRGFFYRIENGGTGTKPTVCSEVTVNYVGTLTSGTTFDSGNDVSFPLTDVITGWQEAVPLIAPGGTIYLYLPPSLAYGSSSNGSIPANSNLIFKVDLKAVK